jgi:hypothetical protein
MNMLRFMVLFVSIGWLLFAGHNLFLVTQSEEFGGRWPIFVMIFVFLAKESIDQIIEEWGDL